MDIFKLIYEHDIRLDALKQRHTDRDTQDLSGTLESFMRPDPTYSKFYFTGTRLDEQAFGLNTLHHADTVLNAILHSLQEYRCHSERGFAPLREQIERAGIGQALILTASKAGRPAVSPAELHLDADSNAGHHKEQIADVLATGDLVLYKEQAKSGYDLHLFSQKNIYRHFFYPIQALVSNSFRFFSMNGKRVNSERHFYFETWTLDRPPHGTEEVFKETVL
ncbi:MAG: hypothetical protein ACNA78_06110 [Balneolaceae bacterium]